MTKYRKLKATVNDWIRLLSGEQYIYHTACNQSVSYVASTTPQINCPCGATWSWDSLHHTSDEEIDALFYCLESYDWEPTYLLKDHPAGYTYLELKPEPDDFII